MSSTSNTHRGLACALTLCAVATFGLLAAHPRGGGHTILEILQAEARDQVKDGVVHGGFILIATILITCLAQLSRLLGPARTSVTTGFVAFCVGAGALMMSMSLDGLLVPAIAVRTLSEGTAQSLAGAQTLLLFCGASIKIAMPMGILFEGAAVVSYSIAMLARKWLWVGWFGVAVGTVILIGPLLSSSLGPHWLIGGIVAPCLWYLGVARVLWVHGADLSQDHPALRSL